MAKVILIDLSDFSHNEIEINLENPLLPIATPLLAALSGQVSGDIFVVI
jgi:5'-3' exonuclease